MAGNPEGHHNPFNEYHRIEVPDSEGVTVSFSSDRLRLLGRLVRKDSGFSLEQAQAFLTLYGPELREVMESAVRDFVKKKVGQ